MDLLNRKVKKILDFRGDYGILNDIQKNKKRLYTLDLGTDFRVITDIGTLHIKTEPGFQFDGRSGPSIIDWYAPNLGTIYERLGWFMHDVLGYATCLDFNSTNNFLKVWLRCEADYSKIKSGLIELAVSLDTDWFGVPHGNDPWRCNLGKYEATWIDK